MSYPNSTECDCIFLSSWQSRLAAQLRASIHALAIKHNTAGAIVVAAHSMALDSLRSDPSFLQPAYICVMGS